jgi:hypothetical protein
MSASNYMIAEPHPTVTAGSYTHSGRGGAGNTFRATPSTAAPAPKASVKATTASRSSRKFYSGIGGAGNVHRPEERATMNFDEEFDRAKVRDAAPSVHVGVGGAGNVFRRSSGSSESGSDSGSSHRASHDSSSSTAGFWGRLSTSSWRH